MCLHVAGRAKRSKVTGVKSKLLHIRGAACSALNWAYMVHLGGYRCPTRLLAILANGVGR